MVKKVEEVFDPKLEKKFADIMEEAIQKAEKVKCPMPDFLAGLEVMMDALAERIETVQGEIGGDEEEGDDEEETSEEDE